MGGHSGHDRVSQARAHLDVLCAVAPDRRPGSTGNAEATRYVAKCVAESGWPVVFQDFACVDWESDGGELRVGAAAVELAPSPYGRGIAAGGRLRVLHTPADLERDDLGDSLVVLTGDLAAEPLTPKAYPFYGSAEHTRMIAALERAAPAAIVAVTGLYPSLCGALDPFPLIEDGDFEIPTANVRPEDAAPLLDSDGQPAEIEIRARRIPARARNVIAARGSDADRLTVIAHVDTKPGTPGAVDNAAGVVVLLLLADLLGPSRCPDLPVGVELLAVNGEDHYAAGGEVAWLAAQGDSLDAITLAVNIDGAGYHTGRSAYSTYNVDGPLADHVESVFSDSSGLVRGPEWYQSDHAIFAMRGRPAVAVTSEHMEQMFGTVFHAPTDTPDKVEASRIIEIADALAKLVVTWPAAGSFSQRGR